jgi:threonine dehydratase
MRDTVLLDDIKEAEKATRKYRQKTRLRRADHLSATCGTDVFLKLDTEQSTGSFKFRGALNAIVHLSDEERKRGVVTASTGNFGRALSYAGQLMNVPVAVCMSRLVPQNKVKAVEELGAEVHIHGKSQDEAGEKVRELIEQRGMKGVSPYDDFYVIAGQGTIGLEIFDECPDVDVVLVPLSGGGLIAGIATALRSINPDIQIIGISTHQCPAMIESLRAGRPVDVEELESIADSLGGGIGLDNRYSFHLTQEYVGLDNTILLDEDEIKEGMRYLFKEEGLVVEGAAAVGVAALLCGKLKNILPDLESKKIVCHISGKNIDHNVFEKIISGDETS